MKLLYVVHQFMPEYTTGTEVATLRLAKAVQKNGHSVSVLTSSLHEESLWKGVTSEGLRWDCKDGVPVYAVPASLISDPYGFAPGEHPNATNIFTKFFNRFDFDLVHVMHSLRMLDALTVIGAMRVPYVMTLTDFFSICYRINYIRRSGEICDASFGGKACDTLCKIGVSAERRQRHLRSVLAGAAERVVCSNFARQQYQRECPDLFFKIIPHGIELHRFPKRAISKEQDEIVFGYLGTISKKKGTDVLVNAFFRANTPNTKLIIVGEAPEHSDVISEISLFQSKTLKFLSEALSKPRTFPASSQG